MRFTTIEEIMSFIPKVLVTVDSAAMDGMAFISRETMLLISDFCETVAAYVRRSAHGILKRNKTWAPVNSIAQANQFSVRRTASGGKTATKKLVALIAIKKPVRSRL